MPKSRLLHGIVPALATPLTADGRQIDEPAVRRLVDFQIGRGVHGLFALGSTAEAVLFPREARVRLAELIIAAAGGRVPTFVHVGAQRVDEVVALARHAAGAGAAGIAVVPPYYYGLDELALEAFFSSVAESVAIPIYLYNIPSNVKNHITATLFSRLAERYAHIQGIKDSSLDFATFYAFVLASEERHSIMMGNDAQILPALVMGAAGAVSAGATVYPEPYVRLWSAYESGDIPAARKWQAVCARYRAVFTRFGIAGLKHLLEMRGIASSAAVRPIRTLTAEERASLVSAHESLVAGLGAERLNQQSRTTSETATNKPSQY